MSQAIRHKIALPNGGHLEFSMEEVTPQKAKMWLESNHTNQRKIHKRTVLQYAAQIKKGLWLSDNAETIKLSNIDGKEVVIDGQHRLSAIVASNVPIFILVVRGIKQKNIVSLDLGKRRTLSDLFKIKAAEFSVKLPTGISEAGLSAFIDGLWTTLQFVRQAQPQKDTLRLDARKVARDGKSVLELFTFFENNPNIVKELAHLQDKQISMLAKSVSLTGNLLGWYIVQKLDRTIADQILETLRDGSPKTESGFNCPAYVLLKFLLKSKQEKVYIRKEEHVAYWLWAYENMANGTTRKAMLANTVHRPAQGHLNTKLLMEKLSEYKI